MITPILRLPPELIANIFRHFLALVLQQSDVRDVFCQLVVVAHLCVLSRLNIRDTLC